MGGKYQCFIHEGCIRSQWSVTNLASHCGISDKKSHHLLNRSRESTRVNTKKIYLSQYILLPKGTQVLKEQKGAKKPTSWQYLLWRWFFYSSHWTRKIRVEHSVILQKSGFSILYIHEYKKNFYLFRTSMSRENNTLALGRMTSSSRKKSHYHHIKNSPWWGDRWRTLPFYLSRGIWGKDCLMRPDWICYCAYKLLRFYPYRARENCEPLR